MGPRFEVARIGDECQQAVFGLHRRIETRHRDRSTAPMHERATIAVTPPVATLS